MNPDSGARSPPDPPLDPDPGTNVLVLDRSTGAAEPPFQFPDAPVLDPSESHVLLISLTRSAKSCLETWDRQVGADPAEGVILCALPNGSDVDLPRSAFSAAFVNSPGALTPLGIRITERVDEWAERGRPIDVQFESISTLLQYVDIESAYRFLSQLTGRCTAANAIARYRLTPAAHDEETVEALSGLFDVVIDRDADGWSRRSR
ncbi:hypothetical protein ACFQAS_03320 [Halopenitus salinus]|uniref:Uncharacterized protein n=1 Tax=Halopenitus salinus TaxID=1198295 RepID=A0ABD5URH3_9EURY